MTRNRLHFNTALLAALFLHGAFMAWYRLPVEEVLLAPPPPLLLSLLAPVVEPKAVPEIVAPVPPPPPPKPKAQPKPLPEPVVEPEPVLEPEPVSETEPVLQEVLQEVLPAETPPPPLLQSEPSVVPFSEVVTEALPEPNLSEVAPSPGAISEVVLPEASAEYERLLTAWLEKHKRYPRRAQRLRIEGEGRLRIRIDHKGRAQNITLEQTTGNALLDQAALEMAHRADPFPAMPENQSRRELEFIVPVAFVLR